MRALTVLQPWASAIACGMKTLETRGWATPYRGLLLIHTSKVIPHGGEELMFDMGLEFRRRGVTEFPLGSVIAIAELADVIAAGRAAPGALERKLGNFTPGRWAWVLRSVHPLGAPVACKGAMGLWQPRWETVQAVREVLPAAALELLAARPRRAT